MNQKLNCILLIDDDEDANFFHSKIIKKSGCCEQLQIALDGAEGIEYLKSALKDEQPAPDIIFLDINMPVMDGWSFLEEYEKLSDEQKARMVIVMLTTSLNPDDQDRADSNPYVTAFVNKYLNDEKLNRIMEDISQ
ncbi:response regulator [Marinoscillum sp. MHG1-6]|uniref:response regulator n=1 Tax=Marinoscillum sp. MHG1-6 TaxID=2959627 RepID=UPI002157D8BF|nr:response regulator [Marinoscillum sp. MHG1-6]